ncbi:hypothetical protein CHLRE_13g577250v5 [Chlamydomonas reinhardtii]|uniref:Uncharacterized protein n=1 Tax=Chlamydomonas reinhardtii TaxID=3055 RepID=A0A2K3D034_CHLRE|nr:uncharacterized protein CHLRE_13g577250v5 [Chlamydomonas reinhardtii]PNW73897.1 hypothetical protein CHLRE_13g577250v5 [Chlamydomonas reinhardtii]
MVLKHFRRAPAVAAVAVALAVVAMVCAPRTVHARAAAALSSANNETTTNGRALLDTSSTSPNPAAFFEMLPFTAKAVSLSMVSIPRTRKYVQGWRRVSSTWKIMAGTIDLDTGVTTGYAPGIAIGCSGPIMMEDGAPLYVGGEFGNSGKKPANIDARTFITRFDPTTGTYTPVGKLSVPRWYPSALRLNDGKVLVVGGTANSDKGPAYSYSELWDSNNPTAPTVPVAHPTGFAATMGLNYYPFMALLPNREILWWGNRGGSITSGDSPFKTILDLPPLPDSYGPWHTMYPYTATVVLHALRPSATTGVYDTFSFTIFGGQNPKKVGSNTPACDKSARLDFTYCGPSKTDICIVNGGWQIETMPDRRLLADAIILPNERIFVHGGATPSGYEGKIQPNPTGDYEYRLTMGTPAEIKGVDRPVITSAPDVIYRGGTFEVTYTYAGTGITGVALTTPCASTHCINMNQRVVVLPYTVDTATSTITVTAPPAAQHGVAPRGEYVLWLLGDEVGQFGKTYSQGHWVTLKEA